MKRKFLLVYNLLLGGIVTTSLSGCVATTPQESTYNILLSYDSDLGKVVASSTSGKLESNTSVTLTITPNEGYKISEVKINGELTDAKATVMFVPKAGTNQVSVSFSKTETPVQDNFKVILDYSKEHGEVSADRLSGNTSDGKDVNVTITPKEGYLIGSIKVNGADQEIKQNFSFKPIAGDNTVTVTFKATPLEDNFNVVLEFNEEHGLVISDVIKGNTEEIKNVSVSITPNEGYLIESIKVNNKDVTVSETITFEPVVGENKVVVAFKERPQEDNFSVKLNFDSEKGTVTSDILSGVVDKVDKVTLTITPKEGYEIGEVKCSNKVLTVTDGVATFKPTLGENLVEVTFNLIPVLTEFNVETIFDEGMGEVKLSKTSGYIEETESVEVTITPKEKHEILDVQINGKSVEIENNAGFATFFTPNAGKNTVEVTFKKLPEEQKFNVKVVVPNEGNVKVQLDKTEGKVGEEVQIVKVTMLPYFELDDILLNGKSIGKDVKTFTPITGENILEIKIKNKEVTYEIDKGSEFLTTITPTDTTDLSSGQELINIVFDKIENELEQKGKTDYVRNMLLAYTDHLNFYENVVTKYGVTKEDVNKFYDIIVTPQVIALFNESFTQEELEKVLEEEIVRGIYDILQTETTLDKFVAFVSTAAFATLNLTLGYKYGHHLANLYSFKDQDSAVAKTINEIALNSKPTDKECQTLFEGFELCGQLIFILLKDVNRLSNYAEFKSYADILIRIFKSIINKTNPNLTETEVYKILALLGDVLNNHFLSKEGYIKFVDQLTKLGNYHALLMKLFAQSLQNDSTLSVPSYYESVINLLSSNKEKTYYLIKTIGFYLREIEQRDVTALLDIFSNDSGNIQLARLLVLIGRHFGAVKTAYEESPVAKAAIESSGELITKIVLLLRDGFIPENIVSSIDAKTLVAKIYEFRNYRYDLISDIELYVLPYVEELADLIPSKDSNAPHATSVSISIKDVYSKNDPYKINEAWADGKNITDEIEVIEFDTSKEGNFVAVFKYKDCLIYRPYSVTNSGINLPNGYSSTLYTIDQGTDPSLFDFTLSFSDGTFKSYQDFEEGLASPIDTSTKGVKTGRVKYSGTYFLFTYLVK